MAVETKNNLDIENIPNELKVILEIINSKNHQILYSFLKKNQNTIDWNKLLDLAMHHRIYPILLTKLKEINDKTIVPPHLVQLIDRLYKKNTFHMLNLSYVMEQICKSLNENNIDLLVLKGPVLAVDLYGDVSLRTSGDIDILVPIEDLEKAESIVTALGYEKDEYIKSVLNDWKWRHHHFTFLHPQTKIKIEIHWRLNPGPGKEPSFAELWQRKRMCSLTSHPIYMLGSEDLFLFLVSHGARHGWSRLRWLMDINRIIDKELDWSTVSKLLKKFNYSLIGGQALILSSQLFHSKVPEEMKSIVDKKRSKLIAQEAVFYFENMVNLHTYPVPEHVFKYHQGHLFSQMETRQRIMYFLSWVHPYFTDVDTLPLPKYMHFLYFPLRPILCIWRKAKHQAIQ